MAADEREPLLGRTAASRDQGPHFKPTKHDPIVKLGTKTVENALVSAGFVDEGKKHDVVARATVLTLFPVAIFNLVLLIFWRFYNTRPLITMAFALQIVIIAGVLPQFSKKKGDAWHQKWKDYLSLFCILAAGLGMAASLLVFYRHLLYYQKYHEMRLYSNIAASSNPMLVADGGIVEFSIDSSLDAGQTVGYRSAEMGVTLCVAPVVDTSMTNSDPISFFAAGIDCCGWRGQFLCGDALDVNARSGLLFIPPRQLVEATMEWAVKDDELLAEYHNAVKLHGSVYGAKASENVRFLRWTANPGHARGEFRHAALLAALGYDAVFICVCAAAAVVTAIGPKRFEQVAEHALATFVRRARAGNHRLAQQVVSRAALTPKSLTPSTGKSQQAPVTPPHGIP